VIALDLSPLGIVIIMMCVLMFLGKFIDQVSALYLTLPFFLIGSNSLKAAFNIDVIRLMVLVLITMEISLLTPPFGLLLYLMKGVAPFKVTLGQIVLSALQFILIKFGVLILLIVFPDGAT
jgi:TRAP-type mannitol/chloroaromatic compound transport system permease large subunit